MLMCAGDGYVFTTVRVLPPMSLYTPRVTTAPLIVGDAWLNDAAAATIAVLAKRKRFISVPLTFHQGSEGPRALPRVCRPDDLSPWNRLHRATQTPRMQGVSGIHLRNAPLVLCRA